MIGPWQLHFSMTELKPLILSILQDHPSPRDVMRFSDVCRQIAMTTLRAKVSAGVLKVDELHVELEDFAIDSVADLFERDNESFTKIRLYFAGFPVEEASNEALLVHLRILIFACVRQNIYRFRKVVDPGLHKILRALHEALRTGHAFRIQEYFGDDYIAPLSCDILDHLPYIDHKELASSVRVPAECPKTIPMILTIVARFLRDQDRFSRRVPLLTLAYAIRSIFAEDRNPVEEAVSQEYSLTPDVEVAIQEAAAYVKRRMHRKYVDKKGVGSETYDAYLVVIQLYLRQSFIGSHDVDRTLFQLLQSEVPNLALKDYRFAKHKQNLEYLLKLTRQRCVKLLRKRL